MVLSGKAGQITIRMTGRGIPEQGVRIPNVDLSFRIKLCTEVHQNSLPAQAETLKMDLDKPMEPV